MICTIFKKFVTPFWRENSNVVDITTKILTFLKLTFIFTTVEEVTPFKVGTKEFSDFVKLSIGTKPGKTCSKTIPQTEQAISTCQEYVQALADPNVIKINVTCTRDDLIFDRSVVLNSFTEYYDLTCGHSIVRNVFNSLYMGGMLLGKNSTQKVFKRERRLFIRYISRNI